MLILLFFAGAVICLLLAMFGIYFLIKIFLERKQRMADLATEEELTAEPHTLKHIDVDISSHSQAVEQGDIDAAPNTAEYYNRETSTLQVNMDSKKIERNQPSSKNIIQNYGDALWVRALVILFIVIGLSIPLSMVESVIEDRQYMQRDALESMLAGWGDSQHIVGPAVVIPYDVWLEETIVEKDAKGNEQYRKQRYKSPIYYKVVLPRLVNFKAEIAPVERYYGIYAATVFESVVDVAGEFTLPNVESFGTDVANIYWQDAIFSLGLSGLRSLSSSTPLVWNGEEKGSFEPSTKMGNILGSGFHTSLGGDAKAEQLATFSTSMNIRGAKTLRFAPVGESNHITIAGLWKDPSFSGVILPVNRTITSTDFTATWTIPHLSRSYPQLFTIDQESFEKTEIREFTVGVDLYEPVTLYRKVERSLKYGFLFIGMTYALLFSLEVIRREKLHYLQYALVGVAMTVFYLSLLSLAEHVSFITAFAIASAICISMNSVYVGAASKSKKQGCIMGVALTILYLCLYILLGLEKYALLVGTGLVLILVLMLMIITRNMNNRTTNIS